MIRRFKFDLIGIGGVKFVRLGPQGRDARHHRVRKLCRNVQLRQEGLILFLFGQPELHLVEPGEQVVIFFLQGFTALRFLFKAEQIGTKLLILGFFLDQLAILILTLPLVFPIMMSLDYHPVWLGIVFVKTAEIGLVSPPLGLNVFIVGSVTDVPVGTVFRGIMPFLVADFTVLALIILFPDLALTIPQIASGVK